MSEDDEWTHCANCGEAVRAGEPHEVGSCAFVGTARSDEPTLTVREGGIGVSHYVTVLNLREALEAIQRIHSSMQRPPGTKWRGDADELCAGCDCGDPYLTNPWPCETRKIADAALEEYARESK